MGKQSTDAGSYGYDAAGNLTTFRGQKQGFNSANQNTANVYDKAGYRLAYVRVDACEL